ncbi:MAG: hypothetical protein E7451_07910 [Ruminococcaceae bacterium]|nr:hypothetical protein [Oscillospiraceae bacterium]
MVDIHCHIVPEVDDGAWDMETAVAMARLAERSGVNRIIATPHLKGVPEELEGVPYILHQFRLLQSALKREKLELELIPGMEVLCVPQTLELAREGRLPTLGKSRYVLTEFYFDASGHFMDSALEGLRRYGYSPVVAHPERYGAVQRDLGLARSWFERGIVLQLNKGSVLGAFGGRAEEAAIRLLYRGTAHIIASDAHSPEFRTPDLEPARLWCLEHLGREYTKILLEDNPGRVARGKPMRQTGREPG